MGAAFLPMQRPPALGQTVGEALCPVLPDFTCLDANVSCLV